MRVVKESHRAPGGACGSVLAPTDAVPPSYCRAFAMHVQVDQREVRAKPVVVFGQTPAADLVEAEDALQDAERMFYVCPHARPTSVFLVTRSQSA